MTIGPLSHCQLALHVVVLCYKISPNVHFHSVLRSTATKSRSKDPSSIRLILHRCLSWVTPLSWWSPLSTWDAELMHAEEVKRRSWEVRQATWCIRSVVPSAHSASSLHCACHQQGNSHPFRSTSCHPDDYGQASEVLRPHCPFGFRWGPHAGPQCRHRRSAEGVETTSRSPSSNMASYNRERPQTTEPGAVVCQAQSIWPWTTAWNRGNGNTPAGASYMVMMMNVYVTQGLFIKCPHHNVFRAYT